MGEWQETTLGTLCDEGKASIQTGPFGSQLHAHDYVDYGVPVIPTSAISLRKIDHSQLVYIPSEKADELRRHTVRRGDILFARRGAQATGLSALITSDENGWLGGTGVIRVRFQSDEIIPEYVSMYLSSPQILEWIQFHALGTTMPNLNQSVLRQLPLIIPSPYEQRMIANIIGTLDDKIELNRRMNATLEATARALFKSWFVDFDPVRAKMEGRQSEGIDAETAALFPDRLVESDLGLIPEGWKIGTVSDDFNLTMGQSPPGETYNEVGEGLPFYQGTRDFGFRFPSKRVYCTQPTRQAEAGDTLVSVRAPVGELNMAIEQCCIGRGVAAVRHKNGSRSYTYYAISSLKQHLANFEGEGTVFGSINAQNFRNIPIALPPSGLISVFEKIVYSIDQQIELNEVSLATLADTRDALLPKLLSGDLIVGEE